MSNSSNNHIDDDIFHMIREGNPACVRVWLDNVENDFNVCDDHSFTLLHWACWDGKLNLVEMLIQRGAKINSLNMCNDTPLHCAVKNGHYDVVCYLIKFKANVNAANLHGNTALHYACYHSFIDIAFKLINSGALINLCNRYSQIPLDLCKKKPILEQLIQQARHNQQNLTIRLPHEENQQGNGLNWRLTRVKSFESTYSTLAGSSINNSNGANTQIDINELETRHIFKSNQTHQTWLGVWQNMDIIIKILNKSNVTNAMINKKLNLNQSNVNMQSSSAATAAISSSQARIINNFQQEYRKLRIFNCNNVLPVLGLCINWPYFIIITKYMPNGTLFNLLHEPQLQPEQQQSLNIKQKLQIAIDIAKGMNFLHQLDPSIAPFIYLNSKHVVLDNDLQARINMSNYVFQTLNTLNQCKLYSPAWQSPESLIKPLNELNKEAVNMWAFAICLWELYTQKIPFVEYSPMQCGLAIVKDNLRIEMPQDMSPHWTKLIRICMNEEPSKRPKFEMIISILEKLLRS